LGCQKSQVGFLEKQISVSQVLQTCDWLVPKGRGAAAHLPSLSSVPGASRPPYPTPKIDLQQVVRCARHNEPTGPTPASNEQNGPLATAGEMDERESIGVPNQTLYVLLKVFSRVTCLSFGVWGTSGSGWRGGACDKNLPQVGVEVCAKFGGDGSGSLRAKNVQTVSFIYTHGLANRGPALPGKNLVKSL